MLDDGQYDAFIVWVDTRDRDQLHFELTITSGAHKGEVVEVLASQMHARDPLDLVGLPCTLVVRGDEIRIVE